jgi:hypothetical protein
MNMMHLRIRAIENGPASSVADSADDPEVLLQKRAGQDLLRQSLAAPHITLVAFARFEQFSSHVAIEWNENSHSASNSSVSLSMWNKRRFVCLLGQRWRYHG